MLNPDKKSKFKDLILITIITILGSFLTYFFLYFERRIIGIDPFYHPDSSYYYDNFIRNQILSSSKGIIENINLYFKNFFSNTLYPSIIGLTFELYEAIQKINFLSFLHNTFYRYVVSLNIMISLIINVILLKHYLYTFKDSSYNIKNLIFFIIILFLPYKMHLSVNILKDIIILLPLVFFFTTKMFSTLLISFMIATPLRYGAIIYYFLFLNYKIFNKKIIIGLIVLTITVSLYLFLKVVYIGSDNTNQDLIISIKEFLEARNVADMGGRSYDNIPNFHEFKTGSIIRALIWPILFISGTFSFFSDSYFMYYLTLEILGIQILIYYFYKKSIISINLILILVIIGVYCNTFTAYFRYAYIAFYLSILISFFNIEKTYDSDSKKIIKNY
jgi:hypothetical protein